MDRWISDIVKEVNQKEILYSEIDYMADVILDLEFDNEGLLLKVKQYEQMIGESNPVEDYVDVILGEDCLVSTSKIADDYGMDVDEFNCLLCSSYVLELISGEYVLKGHNHGLGYTDSYVKEYLNRDGSTNIELDIRWTKKGRLFLYYTLKNFGILPVMERWK